MRRSVTCRIRFGKFIALALCFFLFVSCNKMGRFRDSKGSSTGDAAPSFHLIHTSDVHAAILDGEEKPRALVLYEYVESLRSKGQDVLVVDSGDAFQGRPVFKLLQADLQGPNPISDFFRNAGYSFITLGNHEFDEGMPVLNMHLDALLEANVIPVVTNVDRQNIVQESWQARTRDHGVFTTKSGARILILGFMNDDRNVYMKNHLSGILYPVCADSESSARVESLVADLKKKLGIALVVALSHNGFTPDELIARNCPSLDIIVGGHSHTIQGTPSKQNLGYPFRIRSGGSARRRSTEQYIVHAGSSLEHFGHLRVHMNTDGGIDAERTLGDVYVTDEVANGLSRAEPSRYQESLSRIRALLGGKLGKRITAISQKLPREGCHLSECKLGKFLTKLLYAEIKGKHFPELDAYLLNAGDIREGIRAAALRTGEAESVIPFQNNVVVIEMRCSRLRELISFSRDPTGKGMGSSSYLHVHSAFDLNESVQPACNVALSDFLLEGGDGLRSFFVDARVNVHITQTPSSLFISALRDCREPPCLPLK
jgi:2',3'-cyclic-nucleotide 2'-phosphodiesterase (5'-nucleotidase family)